MYNTVFIVGRLAQMPDFEALRNPQKDALIHLKVYRPFDELLNKKEHDLIPIVLWNGMASLINDTCEIGSYLSIKGRLMNPKEHPQYEDYHVMYIRGESVELLDAVFVKESD